jgi:hypothetical protein
MVGETIYPLTRLAAIAPRAFATQRAKYVGRGAVLDACITEDGLLFLDTVHCAPLHPHHIFTARREAGIPPPSPGDRGVGPLFFEIPLDRILHHRCLWYRWLTPWVNGYPDEEVELAPPVEEFEPFDGERYEELAAVPERHRVYLRRMTAERKPALTFVHIPHVLVAGPIHTGELRVIRADEPPDGRPITGGTSPVARASAA